MSLQQKRVCDRCGYELDRAYGILTVNYHHPKTLDLCKPCEEAFTLWLGRHPLWGKDLQELLKGQHTGDGYPSQDDVRDHLDILKQSEYRYEAVEPPCPHYVPCGAPCQPTLYKRRRR